MVTLTMRCAMLFNYRTSVKNRFAAAVQKLKETGDALKVGYFFAIPDEFQEIALDTSFPYKTGR